MACATVLPPTSSDVCSPNSNLGQISAIRFTRFGDSLTDWADDMEWTTRLSNTTTLPTLPTLAPIRTLFGIGSLAAAERPTIAASRRYGGNIYGTPSYTMTFNVEDTSDANMTFARTLPAGGQIYSGWFETEERLFGGDAGVKMLLIADPIIPESGDDIIRIQVTITFEGTFPEVQDNFLS